MLDRDRRAAMLLSVVIVFLARFSFGFDSPVEVRRFPVSPGDTLVVQLDYGKVSVHARPSAEMEAHLTKKAKTAQQLENIEILGQKQGNKIYLNSYFYSYQGESVSAEIWAPPDLNIVVWGANPDIQIGGMSGYVRVQSLTGTITADDLTASTTLMTDSGNIVYRARSQPASDVRMESVTGSILCELKDDLNFRGWARAGGKLKWNGEIEMNEGSLERQIGLGGPLCYASSLKGQVEFRLRSQLAERSAEPEPPVPSPEPAPPQPRADAGSPTVMVPPPGQGESSSQGPVSRDASGTYSTGYKLKLDVDWIYLNASVRERKTNRSVPNLQKTDFQVYEDGNPQQIGRFLETEEPFHLLLLIDVSGSTQEYLGMIQDACIQFTREIGPEDQIAVASFNSKYRLRQDFTSDRARAVSAIEHVRSGGGTAVYDALLEAVNHISRIEGRKAIVLFSDGVDNQLEGNPGDGSSSTFPQLYREIQEADALIYTIFLDTEGSAGTPSRSGGGVIDILGDILRGGGTGGRRPGGSYPYPRRGGGNAETYEEARQQMEMIAEQTGARMYAPNRLQDLSGVYREIADDLRVQYTLGYNSTNATKDGAWRKVKVAVVNRPDLVVRTRKGYYAAQEQAKNSGTTAAKNLTKLGE